MFESWLNELPTRVMKELYKAFDVDDDYRWGGYTKLYDKMVIAGGPTLVMRAVATEILENTNLKEMLLRLHDRTLML